MIESEMNQFGEFLDNCSRSRSAYYFAGQASTNAHYVAGILCDIILNEAYNDKHQIEYKIISHTSKEFDYIKIPEYYDHLFDLYNRGMLTPETLTPLNIIKIDVMNYNIAPFDAVANYITAVGTRRKNY